MYENTRGILCYGESGLVRQPQPFNRQRAIVIGLSNIAIILFEVFG